MAAADIQKVLSLKRQFLDEPTLSVPKDKKIEIHIDGKSFVINNERNIQWKAILHEAGHHIAKGNLKEQAVSFKQWMESEKWSKQTEKSEKPAKKAKKDIQNPSSSSAVEIVPMQFDMNKFAQMVANHIKPPSQMLALGNGGVGDSLGELHRLAKSAYIEENEEVLKQEFIEEHKESWMTEHQEENEDEWKEEFCKDHADEWKQEWCEENEDEWKEEFCTNNEDEWEKQWCEENAREMKKDYVKKNKKAWRDAWIKKHEQEMKEEWMKKQATDR